MQIRPARKNEVSQLQKLNDEVFTDNQKYDPDLILDWAQSDKGKKYFTDLLNDPKNYCLVAEVDHKLIGYIAASPKIIDYRKSKYLEIENMGVSPAYRGQGIGSLLIKKCLAWTKSRGFQKIYVNAYFANLKGIAFYRKNGFSEIDLCLERKI